MVRFSCLVSSLSRWFLLLLLLNLSSQVGRYGPGKLRFASEHRIHGLQRKATAGGELVVGCAVRQGQPALRQPTPLNFVYS